MALTQCALQPGVRDIREITCDKGDHPDPRVNQLLPHKAGDRATYQCLHILVFQPFYALCHGCRSLKHLLRVNRATLYLQQRKGAADIKNRRHALVPCGDGDFHALLCCIYCAKMCGEEADMAQHVDEKEVECGEKGCGRTALAALLQQLWVFAYKIVALLQQLWEEGVPCRSKSLSGGAGECVFPSGWVA